VVGAPSVLSGCCFYANMLWLCTVSWSTVWRGMGGDLLCWCSGRVGGFSVNEVGGSGWDMCQEPRS
jgi:hypothetical protein